MSAFAGAACLGRHRRDACATGSPYLIPRTSRIFAAAPQTGGGGREEGSLLGGFAAGGLLGGVLGGDDE